VIRILNILVSAAGDGQSVGVEVDTDPVGLSFDCQSAVSVCGRDWILIGV
jgi:hypothetical protein